MDDGRSVEKIRISLKYRCQDVKLATMREKTNSTLMRQDEEGGQCIHIENDDSCLIIEYDDIQNGRWQILPSEMYVEGNYQPE